MNGLFLEVPHKSQRYETVGDWMFSDKNLLTIRASIMDNPDYVFLVQLHELIEAYLCNKRGILQQIVDEFDIDFEKKRPEGSLAEPGDDPKSPYRKEHRFATKIEHLVADELGVNWEKYDQAIREL